MKWSEGLSNRVSIIIRRYIDRIRYVDYMVVPFIIFFLVVWFYFVSLCKWLFVLCFCIISVYCLCVNVYCTAATGCQPN